MSPASALPSPPPPGLLLLQRLLGGLELRAQVADLLLGARSFRLVLLVRERALARHRRDEALSESSAANLMTARSAISSWVARALFGFAAAAPPRAAPLGCCSSSSASSFSTSSAAPAAAAAKLSSAAIPTRFSSGLSGRRGDERESGQAGGLWGATRRPAGTSRAFAAGAT